MAKLRHNCCIKHKGEYEIVMEIRIGISITLLLVLNDFVNMLFVFRIRVLQMDLLGCTCIRHGWKDIKEKINHRFSFRLVGREISLTKKLFPESFFF